MILVKTKDIGLLKKKAESAAGSGERLAQVRLLIVREIERDTDSLMAVPTQHVPPFYHRSLSDRQRPSGTAHPFMSTMSNTTRLASVSMPSSGACIGMMMVSCLREDWSQLSSL